MYQLAVVTPWASPFAWTKTGLNIAQMMARFRRPGWQATVHFGRGIDPASRHIDCCIRAMEAGADLICFVGCDQIHPLDMLDRLVDRYFETDGGVISALVPMRGYIARQNMRPFQPMGWKLVAEGRVEHIRNIEEQPDLFRAVDPDSPPDLERVDIIGSGVLLFDRECLAALKPPWFYDKRDLHTMQRVADTDTRFVWRLRTEAQVQVWVDKTIRVKHIHPFEIDETFQYRFDDMMERAEGRDDIFRYERAD